MLLCFLSMQDKDHKVSVLTVGSKKKRVEGKSPLVAQACDTNLYDNSLWGCSQDNESCLHVFQHLQAK
jgi:hypothetical protein